MNNRVNKRVIRGVWNTMKCQFDYYHSLTETAEKVGLILC
jgi:hypothetical protein